MHVHVGLKHAKVLFKSNVFLLLYNTLRRACVISSAACRIIVCDEIMSWSLTMIIISFI